MGQFTTLLRLAPLIGLLALAADQYKHGDTTHCMLALALAAMTLR